VTAWLAILAAGLVAGTLGGIVGFGASVVMVPILSIAFGPKAAIPIMAIASLMANASRVAIWWREIDWRSALAFAAVAAPCAAIGARTLLALDAGLVEAALGVFLLAVVAARRALRGRPFVLSRPAFAAAAAPVGFLTGIVASTGPISTPLFLALGLVKGAFVGTEAAASVAMYGAKLAVFGANAVYAPQEVGRGLLVGASLMAGAWIAKRIVVAMSAERFRGLMDVVLLGAGLLMLARGLGVAG
jgi:hypothetical protein